MKMLQIEGMRLLIICVGEALDSLKYQHANYTAWLNGTESNFTMVRYCHKIHCKGLMYFLKPPEDPTLSPFVHSLLPTPHRFDGQDSYYRNISGFLNGPSKFHNLISLHDVSLATSNETTSPSWYPFADQFLKHAQINATEVAERKGSYNWTGIDKITITIMEFRHGNTPDSIQSPEALTLLHVCTTGGISTAVYDCVIREKLNSTMQTRTQS